MLDTIPSAVPSDNWVQPVRGQLHGPQIWSTQSAVLRSSVSKRQVSSPIVHEEWRGKSTLLNAAASQGPVAEVTGVIGVGQKIAEICRIASVHERLADGLSRLMVTATALTRTQEAVSLVVGVGQGITVIDQLLAKLKQVSKQPKEEAVGKGLVNTSIGSTRPPSARSSTWRSFARRGEL
jgi:hypothetical protein